jgi:hypothetical protein
VTHINADKKNEFFMGFQKLFISLDEVHLKNLR